MTRFVCTGDLHLGKGASLGKMPGERLAAQTLVWERIVDLASEVEAAAILFAGDAFEGPIPTPEEYAAFRRGLSAADCAVIAITGNGRHDAAMRDHSALEVFDTSWLRVADAPTTTRVRNVTVCCLPWTSVSRLVAAEGGGDRDEINRRAAEKLVEVAAGLRSDVTGPSILLLHWSISGATTSSGTDVGVFREPVLPLGDLAGLGYDAVVAGHIHRPQIVNPAEAPPVFYVGSPLPLDFGEAGHEHGCYVLDLGGDGLGGSVTFHPLPSRPLVEVNLDLVESGWDPAVYVEPAPGWPDEDDVAGAIVKLRVRATEEQLAALDLDGMRRGIEALGAHHVWQVAADVVRVARARADVDEAADERELLDRWLVATGKERSDEWDDRLRERHHDYLEEVR